MRVHKTTNIKVGDGSPQAIIEALSNCEVPPHAKVTRADVDYSDVMMSAIIDPMFLFQNVYVITFEWDDDE